MTLRPDSATLSVVLFSESHSIADVQFITSALDGIIAAGIWGGLATAERRSEDFAAAHQIVSEQLARVRARSRFYPGFDKVYGEDPSAAIPMIEVSENHEYDPQAPLDAGAREGMNSFLRRAILQQDRDLYSRLFGFAGVTRVEHHSPLLLELGIALTVSVAVPALIVIGAMRAAVAIRKTIAEADIRETQSEILREELRQKQLQTRILNEIAETAEQLKPEEFPRDAISKAAEVSTTAVSDLGTSPLIGSLTFGFSSKSG